MEAMRAVGVCRSYGSRKVLDGFSLKLAPAEFAVLMGPSGSGKSTFLHIAAGLLAADAGSVEIGGTDMVLLGDAAATKYRRRHIGMVFQDYNLIDTLTVADNIALPLRLDRRQVDARRVGELLERLGLTGLERKRPDELSGGECQRVAIARALITSPAVILADEPTGNLDAAAARSFCALLKEINASEKTAILMVTHDPVAAASASRVHLLKNGSVAGSFDTGANPSLISARYLEMYG